MGERTDGGQQQQGEAARRLVRRGVWLWALFHAAFAAWVLLHPRPPLVFQIGDDAFQTVGGLLAAWLCLAGARGRRADADGAARTPRERWAPRLFAVSLLCYGLGQATWSLNELVLHRSNDGFGTADVWYLASYPFLLAAILLLPTAPLPASSRPRILLDAVMNMTAIVTFGWFFLLGPTLLNPHLSLSAKFIAVAYPTLDLVLVFCVLLLGQHAMTAAMRRITRVVSLGLAVTVTTDAITCFQALHGQTLGGGLIDLGWSLGYMPVGVAVGALRLLPSALPSGRGEAPRSAGLWQSLLPYAFLPAVGALLLTLPHGGGAASALSRGVYAGGGVLVSLVLLRQVLAILENRALNARLVQTQSEMRESVRAMTDANARLEALATTDAVSGLINHRGLVSALDAELARAGRHGHSCAVLVLDLDHFKSLNDAFGHAAGDAALAEVGAVLRERLRGEDVAGRWGGEEFVALLPETDRAGALAAAESVRAAVGERAFAVAGGVRLTCSVGVAVFPADAGTRADLVDAADRAMYAAKRLGRDQVRAADEAVVLTLAGPPGGDRPREEAALLGTVEALAALVEARECRAGVARGEDVAALAARLALAMGRDPAEARAMGLAARLHDVGQVAVPDALLWSEARLTAHEWEWVREHPQIGADAVGRVPALRALAPLIRSHHERWDGRGYPDGLAGEAIPLGARIIAVADAYGAMTRDRPHQAAGSPEWALDELRRSAGAQFDPAVVAALSRLMFPLAVAA